MSDKTNNIISSGKHTILINKMKNNEIKFKKIKTKIQENRLR